jgi:hypothetical protein
MTKGSKLTLYFCTYFKYGRYQFATNLLPFFGKTRQPSHKKALVPPRRIGLRIDPYHGSVIPLN